MGIGASGVSTRAIEADTVKFNERTARNWFSNFSFWLDIFVLDKLED